MNKKVGRNDPCPCGSGKKFKKCCERKMISKKYLAHKINNENQTSNLASKISGLSSVFQGTAKTSTKQFKISKNPPPKTIRQKRPPKKEK